MKRITRLLITASLLASTASFVYAQAASQWIVGGARYHESHSVAENLPFDDGDLSGVLGYEYHEQSAYWQLAVDYCPSLGGTNTADSAITPQVNLIFKKDILRAGAGALISYVWDDVQESDWTDVYWQFLIGANLTLGKHALNLYACYPFEEWDQLSDFDFGDIEYALLINLWRF
jgi:hypothetical protein